MQIIFLDPSGKKLQSLKICSDSEEVKKGERAPNVSRVSYSKTLSLYFINSNTLAIVNNCNHDWNQIAKQTKPYPVKKST